MQHLREINGLSVCLKLATFVLMLCWPGFPSAFAQPATEEAVDNTEEVEEVVDTTNLHLQLADQVRGIDTFSYPGGVAELHLVKLSDTLPTVRFGIREPVIIPGNDYWRVLIGLPLDTVPGEYVVYVKEADEEILAYNTKFMVRAKEYTFSDPDSTLPEVARSFANESFSELDFANTNPPQVPLQLPLEGQWADFFGHMSATGNNSENFSVTVQNFVSLTTTEHANVVSPQNAIVSKIVFQNELEQVGSVFLDHGRGLYSVLSGIDNITVEVGDGIVAGAIIGRLPQTSDNIQPVELIWQCVLNDVFVNPLVLTELQP